MLLFIVWTCCLVSAQEKDGAAENSPHLGQTLEEEMLIEMRLRALQAESDVDGSGSDLPLAMSIEELDSLTQFPGSLGVLPASLNYPVDNYPTADRIELGRKLFFDKRLSRNQSMSCATCHDPAKGWSDGLARAQGYEGQELGRHSPTIINAAFGASQFWDGRADTLEIQALGPILATGEMNMPSPEAAMEMIKSAQEYRGAFEKAYGTQPEWETVGRALAAFERTIITGPSRFDEYVLGDKSALNDSEKRGLILFTTTASCSACHNGSNFTDNKFHAIGIKQSGPLLTDEGRYGVTKNEADRNCFKTPGLRNVEQSAPYMHDGSLATLEEVVDFYNKGDEAGSNRSKLIRPLRLTDSQKSDLVAFLKSLTGRLSVSTIANSQHYDK